MRFWKNNRLDAEFELEPAQLRVAVRTLPGAANEPPANASG
jgi:hypothetical protein